MLGIPTKELKQATVHADQTLSKVDRVLDTALAVLVDVKAMTTAARLLVESLRKE